MRTLTAPPADIPWRGGIGTLIGAVQEAGLTGRGGAGFPTWRKLAEVATADNPVVIGNAAEGEPASAKDVTLLARNPHLVLDGLQLTAETIGASKCYLYAGSPAAVSVRQALAGRADRFPVTVVEAPDTFVAGEESAVVSAVDGRRPVPRDKPRLLVRDGLLVQNVETLANVTLIARHGPAWFRRLGTRDEPGTFLATVSGAATNPGVVEVPIGRPMDEVIQPSEPLQAVLVGGYHGTWLPFDGKPLSQAGLTAALGAGVLVALPQSCCGVVESARIMTYLAGQSTRQCGPCRLGLPRIAELLTEVAQRRATVSAVHDLHVLAGLVTGRGACGHPDGGARLLRSSLTTFDREIGLHLRGGCSHGRSG
ncbi:MAG: NADH-ubiquinone oxidoreductase-F iron-sulfur binding region domain-containing protein [Kibdelosporangium sp.]